MQLGVWTTGQSHLPCLGRPCWLTFAVTCLHFFTRKCVWIFFSKCFHKLLKPSFFSWVWSLLLIYKGWKILACESATISCQLISNCFPRLRPRRQVKTRTEDVYSRMIICPAPWSSAQLQFGCLGRSNACLNIFHLGLHLFILSNNPTKT